MTACQLCADFYGDAAPCDESKPQCSPHRRPDGRPGPWPMRTIAVVGLITCADGKCGAGLGAECRTEHTRLKAAIKASKHAVWPPVPKGYGPPASHLRQPTLTSPHPLGWVNEAMRPAWRRFAERQPETARQRADFERAERAAQQEFARRQSGKAVA